MKLIDQRYYMWSRHRHAFVNITKSFFDKKWKWLEQHAYRDDEFFLIECVNCSWIVRYKPLVGLIKNQYSRPYKKTSEIFKTKREWNLLKAN